MTDSSPTTAGRDPGDIARLQALIGEFCAARSWQQFHDPKNLAMAIGVEVGELMDHFRWLRNDESIGALKDPTTRCGVEDETADVMILLLEFASVCKIDLVAAVEAKLAKNALRYPVNLCAGSALKHDRLR